MYKEYAMKIKHAYQILYTGDNIVELDMILKEVSGCISACSRIQCEGEKTISLMYTPMDSNGVEHNRIQFNYNLRTGIIMVTGYNNWTRSKVNRRFPFLIEDLEEDLYRIFDEDITIML